MDSVYVYKNMIELGEYSYDGPFFMKLGLTKEFIDTINEVSALVRKKEFYCIEMLQYADATVMDGELSDNKLERAVQLVKYSNKDATDKIRVSGAEYTKVYRGVIEITIRDKHSDQDDYHVEFTVKELNDAFKSGQDTGLC